MLFLLIWVALAVLVFLFLLACCRVSAWADQQAEAQRLADAPMQEAR